MVRQIIKIDEEKCNGCGKCVTACHESALAIIDGKAKLIRDDYCDGMGDCLKGGCPTGALSFETREAADYDEEAVQENLRAKAVEDASAGNVGVQKHESTLNGAESHEHGSAMNSDGAHAHGPAGGCPGSRIMEINRRSQEENGIATMTSAAMMTSEPAQLRNWPVQIKLAPVKAPYFDGAKLLIAADCTAYAYASFHRDFIKGKVTLIGCPKLDAIDYSEKLQAIMEQNDIRSVTIVRMEVPCCGGLQMAAEKALRESGKFVPWNVVTISIDGEIME